MDDRETLLKVGVIKEGLGGFGELIVSPGRAILNSWPVRRQLVVHTAPTVIVVRPRINPFGRRTVFVLKATGAAYGVRASLGPLKRLEDALVSGGFELEPRETLIDVLPRPPFWSSKS